MLHREIIYNYFKNHLTHTNHNVPFPDVPARGINNQQWTLHVNSITVWFLYRFL